jgi:hypothetical protein
MCMSHDVNPILKHMVIVKLNTGCASALLTACMSQPEVEAVLARSPAIQHASHGHSWHGMTK